MSDDETYLDGMVRARQLYEFLMEVRAPGVLGLCTAPSTLAALARLVSDSQYIHETINGPNAGLGTDT